ncbi:hypothetical protein ABPG74_016668 [Tetrahymena malaccensis]
MAFPKLKSKGLVLKIQNQNIENNSSAKESHIAATSNLSNSQVYNITKCRINQDYQKAFDSYYEREPQKIKPKPFQKTKVFKLFQQLEDDLNSQISNLSHPKKDLSTNNNKLEGSTQLLSKFDLQMAFKKQENEIKRYDYFYQEKVKFQNLFHQNSLQNLNENDILNKSDQNIKQTLKRLEQINDLKYEPNYYNNNKKNQDLVSKELSKIIKIEDNSSQNNNKPHLLPQLINFKANRSHSPKRANEDQSQIDQYSKNIQEESHILKQKQIYLQNRQESFIVKKLKKQTIDYLDEIIESFVNDIQNSQNDTSHIHQAVKQLITRIFNLRELQTIQLKNILDSIDNIYFCKKNNPLIEAINQQFKNTKIQEVQKIPYKDICLLLCTELTQQNNNYLKQINQLTQQRDQFNEKIKSLQQISTSQSITKGDKLKQENNLNQFDDGFKQVESIKYSQYGSKQQFMQTISEILDQKNRDDSQIYENNYQNKQIYEDENSKLEDYFEFKGVSKQLK